MSGLENIINEIQKKAELEASEILKEAENYCNAYMTDAKEKIALEVLQYEKNAKKDRELYENKAQSGIEALERNAVLETKQKNIQTAFEKAYEKIANLSDEEYFSMLASLLQENVLAKTGEILFGKRDLQRLTETFEGQINKIAEAKGGSLTIVKEPANIPDGFILRYGMIEENCTIKALFETKKNQLKDIASKELFI